MAVLRKESTGGNGFTLVEVVVVAVIIAVLAAIAIPLYNGFVRDTRQNTVNNLAETVAGAANAHWRKTGQVIVQAHLDTNMLRIHYDTEKYAVALDGSSSIKVTEKNSEPEISKSVTYK